MAEPFAVPIDDPQPSQLYLCDEKLLAVLEWFDADDSGYDPIPVAEIDGELVMLDGHHRAFVALLAGADERERVRDTSEREEAERRPASSADDLNVVRASDLDRTPYRTCVGWCVDAGVESVCDLAGRVLDRASYEEQWIERCHDAFDHG